MSEISWNTTPRLLAYDMVSKRICVVSSSGYVAAEVIKIML